MTAQQPFRQSADPLSENSRISWNYCEWVCGLAQALTGNHYVNAHMPAQPASNNQLEGSGFFGPFVLRGLF